MVDQLSDHFEFWIVTKDRDLGEQVPFAGVPTGQWVDVGLAKVHYVPRRSHHLLYLRSLIRSTPHDVVYLNSVFAARSAVLPLVLRRFGQGSTAPLIIAPRGEFGDGAYRTRQLKKLLYLRFANTIGLFRSATWQASSELEAAEIRFRMGDAAGRVCVAPNLVPLQAAGTQSRETQVRRVPGPLRLVFVARISPKKNLDFLLRVLCRVAQPTELMIVGPVDEPDYWRQCQATIYRLPRHIRVSTVGAVLHQEIGALLARHDLFVFPTLNENFGHVVIEALGAGTPVAISPHTPWQPDDAGALTTVPLDEDRWAQLIDHWASMSDADLQLHRRAARDYADRFMCGDQSRQQNLAMFLSAIL